MIIIIYGIACFFIFKLITKGILGFNDREHSSGKRYLVSAFVGIAVLILLTGLVENPTLVGFFTVMSSIGVYNGFSGNIKRKEKEQKD